MIKIDTVEQFEQILEGEGSFFIFKHSLTCPISQAAFEEYESFTKTDKQLNHYYLTVQEARPLSNHIAEKYHVKHESPQAILFKNEDIAWHASHRKITKDSLIEAQSEQ